MNTNWDMRFLDLAKHIATWSKDLSTGVGAVIVDNEQRIVSIGYNGFCTGCNDDVQQRYQRPEKYFYTEHAERNAIYNAARIGVSVKNCKLYSTLFPCAECCRAIIQSGITTVITKEPDLEHHKYGKSFKVSLEMFEEVGVKVSYL
jgi:dCMP deaminase